MADPYYPTIEDAAALHNALMATAGEPESALINSGALSGALHRPQQAAHYEDADVAVQAALLMGGVALAHAFEDGNKRTAVMIGDVFLQRNGWWIDAEPFALAREVLSLVNRTDSERVATKRLADWLRARLRPVKPGDVISIPSTVYDFDIDLTDTTWGTEPIAEFGGLTIAERRAEFLALVKQSQDEPVGMGFANFNVFNRAYLFILREPRPGFYLVRAFASGRPGRPRPAG